MMELYPAEIKITSRHEDKTYCLAALNTLQWKCQLLIFSICCPCNLYQLSRLLLTFLETDMNGVFIIMCSATYGNTLTSLFSKVHVMIFQCYIIADSRNFSARYSKGITIYSIIL